MVGDHNRAPYRALILPATLLVALMGLIIAAACAPIYAPNAAHTTLAPKEGTLQGGAYYGSGMFNVNAGLTIAERLSLLGSFSYEPWSFTGKPLDKDDSSRAAHMAHTFGELGLGYTILRGDTARRRSTQLDVLAGFGIGRASALWPTDSNAIASMYPLLDVVEDTISPLIYRLDGAYRRVFAQATLSFLESSPKRRHEAVGGFLLKGSYVWFTELARENRSTLHPRAFFIDPVAFFRTGTRQLQFEMQGGFSVKIPANDDKFRVQVIFIELGVHAMLDDLW